MVDYITPQRLLSKIVIYNNSTALYISIANWKKKNSTQQISKMNE